MSSKVRPPVLVTIGDPNGIGPEIAVKAAISLHESTSLRPVVIGDRHIVEPLASKAGFTVELVSGRWGSKDRSVDLFDAGQFDIASHTPGEINAAAGEATVGYVRIALELVKSGAGRAIVGCPHSETAVNLSGRRFSGYPALLAELLETGPDSVFLVLVGGGMRVVHVTLHEATAKAIDRLSPELIQRAVSAADVALRDLGIEKPRIGVFGINPHAGENGLFGDEDDRIVSPALTALRASGIDVYGPEGADTLLARKNFDAFVAMYHDQGHIPVKLLAGRTAAALSVGAGVLFSSVGHGAAFDIAGRDQADPDATLRAIHLVGGSV